MSLLVHALPIGAMATERYASSDLVKKTILQINGTQPRLRYSEQWKEEVASITNAAHSGGIVIFSGDARNASNSEYSCLTDTLTDIDSLAALEDNWNDEGAPIIDRGAILRARKFVIWLGWQMNDQPLTSICEPTVFPTIEGGVKLYWLTSHRQTSLTFRPDCKAIDVVEKEVGKNAGHRELSENETGPIALKIMREAA